MSEFVPADILLVEDNENDAELTMRALRTGNVVNRLVWVKDGAEALDYVFRRGAYSERADECPRLLLLDLKMPKVDGLEVLAAIKLDERAKRIPVVVMTSSREDRDLAEAYRLGVNSYIVKPLDFDRFVEVVATVGLYWAVVNAVPT